VWLYSYLFGTFYAIISVISVIIAISAFLLVNLACVRGEKNLKNAKDSTAS